MVLEERFRCLIDFKLYRGGGCTLKTPSPVVIPAEVAPIVIKFRKRRVASVNRDVSNSKLEARDILYAYNPPARSYSL